VRRALFSLSFWCVPDAVMQYARPDIDRLLINVDAIERRRNRMVSYGASKDMTCTFLTWLSTCCRELH
jgi:hypothetical protein